MGDQLSFEQAGSELCQAQFKLKVASKDVNLSAIKPDNLASLLFDHIGWCADKA